MRSTPAGSGFLRRSWSLVLVLDPMLSSQSLIPGSSRLHACGLTSHDDLRGPACSAADLRMKRPPVSLAPDLAPGDGSLGRVQCGDRHRWQPGRQLRECCGRGHAFTRSGMESARTSRRTSGGDPVCCSWRRSGCCAGGVRGSEAIAPRSGRHHDGFVSSHALNVSSPRPGVSSAWFAGRASPAGGTDEAVRPRPSPR
jgi:hypothetical protein